VQHRPFRFGVQLGSASSAEDWVAKVRRVEELGYSVLTICDHVQDQLSPVPALMMAAAKTERLRLGTYVLGNDFRHPAAVAKEAATLDLLSGGRFELGIGAGWMPQEYSQLGIPFDRHPARLARLQEAVHLIKGLLAGETVNLEGHYYSVRSLVGDPRPVQQPRPPILIGGGGRNLLSFAAREADIVGINLRVMKNGHLVYKSLSAEATEEKMLWIREAAGSRIRELELNLYLYFVLPHGELKRTSDEWHEHEPEITPDFLTQSPHAVFGSVNEMVEQLQTTRERYGISYITVQEHNMDKLAPVVAALAGR
jgi:probable F420-dependent oxidoreductase